MRTNQGNVPNFVLPKRTSRGTVRFRTRFDKRAWASYGCRPGVRAKTATKLLAWPGDTLLVRTLRDTRSPHDDTSNDGPRCGFGCGCGCSATSHHLLLGRRVRQKPPQLHPASLKILSSTGLHSRTAVELTATSVARSLGWNGLGFNGHNQEVKTPTIDALAKGGIILDNH